MKKTSTAAKYKADKKAKAKPAAAPPLAAPNGSSPKGDVIAVGAAKGRPMLQWVGKRPLRSVTAFPAQLVETFDPTGEGEKRNSESGNLLFHGDNKEVLAHLLANGYRGKIDLVYIDPPFDSGADYVRKVSLRGKSATAKLDGEAYSLGEQTQYEDIWANDQYLQFMYERLILLKELMAEGAGLYLHCDWKRMHLLRLLLDEILGHLNFRNEIARIKCNPKNAERKAFGNIHDTILYYVKGDLEDRPWNAQREAVDSEDLARLFEKIDPKTGRRFTTVALHARGTRRGETGKPWKGVPPPPGRHWAYVHAKLDEFDRAGLVEWSTSGNPRLIRYADEKEGDLVQDIWTMKDPEEDLYPTEKAEEVLERIVAASSNPDSIIFDCFIGSGTTAAVAQKLGRRWIGCDINKGAIQTTSKRLQGIIREQIEEKTKREAQGELIKAEDPPPEPAALSFGVYRVNDYDLQIQHNEAVALACEHIGVTRSRTDGFFDGTQGKRLVKIVPFNHPLSPLDLEEVVRELKARKNEERDILLVCLGKELAADAWLERYNQMRKKGSVPNKIEVIELRTDPKYGKFIAHKPASAKVAVRRKGGEIHVEIQDFMSPSILERLETQADLLTPQVKDWRAMVDCVMIDTAFDGEVFNISLSDIPEKKAAFVEGTYTLPAPEGETTVAVKIIDMLGEEVVITRAV